MYTTDDILQRFSGVESWASRYIIEEGNQRKRRRHRNKEHRTPLDYRLVQSIVQRCPVFLVPVSSSFALVSFFNTSKNGGKETDQPSSRGEAEFDAFLRSFPCVCFSRLQALLGRLRGEWKELVGLDISHPCSHSNDSLNCWILRYLSPLNKYLHQANVDAVEYVPAYLKLCSFDAGKEYNIPELDYLVGSFVALFLVKMHRCVRYLELDSATLVLHYPDVLASSIAAAPGLRYISVNPDPYWQEFSFFSVIAALRRSSQLEYLNVCGFELDRRSSNELAEVLLNSRIRTLILDDMSFWAAKKILNAINSCASLSTLCVHGSLCTSDKVSKVLASALAKNNTLRSLSATGVTMKGADRVLRALKTCTLENLVLIGRIGTRGTLSRRELQQTAARLKSLQLSLRVFGSPCAAFLAEALRASSCVLEKLDISFCCVDDLGAALLAKALLVNNTLKQLNLEGCELTALSVEPFVSSLAQNSTIECVRLGALRVNEDLSFSPVEKTVGRLVTSWNTCGTQELARVLRSEDCTVTSLELAWTRSVAISCVSDVFHALCGNKHIIELRLQLSEGLGFASDLISLLQRTQSLRRLIVSQTFRDYEFVGRVLYALSENHTITEAEFPSFELFTNEAVSALKALLRHNKQVTSLTFQRHDLDSSTLKCLAHAMMDNHVITKLSFTHLSHYSESYELIVDILNRNLSLMNRAKQFLRTEVLDYLDAFRKICDSHAFANNYAAAQNIPVQAARVVIAAALNLYGHGAEREGAT